MSDKDMQQAFGTKIEQEETEENPFQSKETVTRTPVQNRLSYTTLEEKLTLSMEKLITEKFTHLYSMISSGNTTLRDKDMASLVWKPI